jgi:hypothetical protein
MSGRKKKIKVLGTTPEARALQKKIDNPKINEQVVMGGPKAVLGVARGLARRSNLKDKLDMGLDTGETVTDNKKPPSIKKRKKIKVKRRPQGHA